jgi:hypothetical protein
MKKRIESLRGRVGPLGSALAAAALTAAAFAAISVAQDGGGSEGKEDADEVHRAGAPMKFEHSVVPTPEISAEDREALESFRKCMEENGADLPMPPEPGALRRGERPEPPQPPSEEEREAIDEALEACEDQLPEGAHFGIGPCGDADDGEDDDDAEDGAREEEDGAEMEGAATS